MRLLASASGSRVSVAGCALAIALGCAALGSEPPRVAPTPWPAATRPRAVVMVSPHPDDESILAAATLSRAARDPRTTLRAITVSSGDASGWAGPCHEESEFARTQKVVALRESEALAAWRELGVDPGQLHFLRHPDTKLVARSQRVDGRRVDEPSEAGARAVREVEQLLPALVPADAEELIVITASLWDAHGDHRTAYRAARAGALRVRAERGIPVTLLSGIVHDEWRFDVSFCCAADGSWPEAGPQDDYPELLDSRARPRPPPWDVVYDASDQGDLRRRALERHASQVEGNPGLCISFPTVATRFMRAWMDKRQEPFYREEL